MPTTDITTQIIAAAAPFVGATGIDGTETQAVIDAILAVEGMASVALYTDDAITGRVVANIELNDGQCAYVILTRKYIPVEEAFQEWRKDAEYVVAYDAMEEEFALASALIKARGDADMTQEHVAAAMKRRRLLSGLESARVLPSTRTLERVAKATHTRLRIRFEPETPCQEALC
jgi:hypothetical protein